MFKSFTLRLRFNLYNKLRVYAENNDMTISGAVRAILFDFFNKNNT